MHTQKQQQRGIGRLILAMVIIAAVAVAGFYWLEVGPFSQRLGFYQFEVIDGPLQIRSEPAGERVGEMAAGQRFLPDLSQQMVRDGLVWIKHHDGYSALHKVDGSEIYANIVITGPDEPLNGNGLASDAA